MQGNDSTTTALLLTSYYQFALTNYHKRLPGYNYHLFLLLPAHFLEFPNLFLPPANFPFTSPSQLLILPPFLRNF